MLKEEKIKTAFLAGEFYPSEKTELEKTIENFLPKKNFQKIKSKLWGVLAPSDHYLLCGFVLGSIYSILRQTYYKTVILVSDFFGKEREEISIWSEGKWETPLGEVSVDEELAKSFLNFQKRVVFDEKIYFFDSFLEPQLPFLQKVFGNFKILPILFGQNSDWEWVSEKIFQLITNNNDILVLAVSNLSYGLKFEKAKKVDLELLKIFGSRNFKSFDKKLKSLEKKYKLSFSLSRLAKNSIKVMLKLNFLFRGRAKILNYQNSGHSLFGNKIEVVGYGGIGYFRK